MFLDLGTDHLIICLSNFLRSVSMNMSNNKRDNDGSIDISGQTEETGQSLFVYIDEWDGKRLYLYILILIIIVWLISQRNVTLNLIVGLGVAYFVISYLNHRSKTTNDTRDDIIRIKKAKIEPKPLETTNDKEDVRNFLFSVQDLRVYNAQAYEEMVRKIDAFFEYYTIVFVEPSRSYVYYELMEQAKRDALNALKSLVFEIPEDKRVRAKLNRATDVMDEVLTKYLDQVSHITDEYTYKYGYNVDTKVINYGTKPFNQYDDIYQPYSYEIY